MKAACWLAIACGLTSPVVAQTGATLQRASGRVAIALEANALVIEVRDARHDEASAQAFIALFDGARPPLEAYDVERLSGAAAVSWTPDTLVIALANGKDALTLTTSQMGDASTNVVRALTLLHHAGLGALSRVRADAGLATASERIYQQDPPPDPSGNPCASSCGCFSPAGNSCSVSSCTVPSRCAVCVCNGYISSCTCALPL